MSLKFTSKNTLKRIFTRLSEIFVKKSDIVDNLTSSDTNKPLSANQGNVLNKSISTLNSNFVVTCSTGTSRSITTEAFLNYLVSEGKIPTHKYMERKIMCTWAYANNAILTDTPVKVCLAGCFLEMVGNYTGSLSNSANNFMMRLTCSPVVWTSYPDSKNKTYVFRAVGGSYSWTELSNIQEIDDNITMVALGYTKGQNVELFDFYSNIISGKYNVGDRIKFNYSNEHTANVVVGTSSISMNGVTMVIERIPTSSWDIFIASIFTRLGGVYVFTIRFEGSFTSNYVQYIGTLAANQ